jgi:hypothetical protein
MIGIQQASVINKYLKDKVHPPVAPGPLVSGVRKDLANIQDGIAPLLKRVPLPV